MPHHDWLGGRGTVSHADLEISRSSVSASMRSVELSLGGTLAASAFYSLSGSVSTLQTKSNVVSASVASLTTKASTVSASVHGIEDSIWPSTDGYAYDDALALESNLSAPHTGTAPARTAYNGPGGTGDWSLWTFANNSTRYLQSAVQLPHSYQEGTPLMWHVHFIPGAVVATDATIIFKAEITHGPVYGSMTSEALYTSTYTAPATRSSHNHLMTVSATIPATGLSGSGFVLGRIYRDNTDTYTGDVWLLGSDYHIKKNRAGSGTENPST